MTDMAEKKPLWHDILQFSRNKNKIAVGFISLGIVGLALPVISGFALLGAGVFLLKPGWVDPLKKNSTKFTTKITKIYGFRIQCVDCLRFLQELHQNPHKK